MTSSSKQGIMKADDCPAEGEKRRMLPLKLVRSLVLGETITTRPFLSPQNRHIQDLPHSDSDADSPNSSITPNAHSHRNRKSKSKANAKTPLLLFMPAKELVTDTYRLATLARDIGMDLHPNPSLSHIIFSWPSSSQPSASSSFSSSSYPSFWSSTSLSSSSSLWSLPNDAVPLPFPSLAAASVSHLRCFVGLSRGFFKLVFLKSSVAPSDRIGGQASNWDCCSVSLISRRGGDRIESMDGFSRALAGVGWTLFKTTNSPSLDSGNNRVCGTKSVYLFRKVDSNRVRIKQGSGDGATASGECRIRELRLPALDFRNAPLRILQYILLMTGDIFYLA
ncbi:uncharacterized protein LOC127800438 [Diospyros lotus]|uniref:uncharacterized protein LOC127800438 n=1 Tax=Diospyros lotus TaxID=55363 RepID=UPI00224D12F5|nr:uncharacterized protein LOC127800438 [Diospyros lotus]